MRPKLNETEKEVLGRMSAQPERSLISPATRAVYEVRDADDKQVGKRVQRKVVDRLVQKGLLVYGSVAGKSGRYKLSDAAKMLQPK